MRYHIFLLVSVFTFLSNAAFAQEIDILNPDYYDGATMCGFSSGPGGGDYGACGNPNECCVPFDPGGVCAPCPPCDPETDPDCDHCPPGTSLCGSGCCSGGEQCLVNSCCPFAQVCGSNCCPVGTACQGNQCVGDPCPPQQQCGSECCPPGVPCNNGICQEEQCPTTLCNGICCPSGFACEGGLCLQGECEPSSDALFLRN